MSQHDMVIENQGFAATRADINAAFAAMATNSSGATAPATTYAFQWWADTGSTPPMLRQRNAANNDWLPIGPLADLGIQTGAQSLATVGGTADALTLTFSPALTALHGGVFHFVAASDNATTTPTGNPDGLGAKTFIKGNNLALVAGDIKSGMTMLARYDSVLGKLVVLNPATGVSAGVVYASGAEAQALTETGKAISPSTLAAALQGSNQSLASSGYQKLPGGLILQWGLLASSTNGADDTITYPIAFTVACYTVVCTVRGGFSSTYTAQLNGTPGTASFGVAGCNAGARPGGIPIYWYALGK